MTDRALDLRDLAFAEQLESLLSRLDGLDTGDRLMVTTTEWPGDLLGAVERARPGDFIVGPVGDDPGEHRIEFGRRADGKRSVSDFVGWDQRRLDDILDEVDELASGENYPAAQHRYREFRFGLRHHHQMEEGVLFPLYEKLHGAPGPIPSMHAEHVLINACADDVGDALNAHDLAAFAEAIEQLHEVLDAHDRREEREVYPLIDDLLSLDDREKLVTYLQVG